MVRKITQHAMVKARLLQFQAQSIVLANPRPQGIRRPICQRFHKLQRNDERQAPYFLGRLPAWKKQGCKLLFMVHAAPHIGDAQARRPFRTRQPELCDASAAAYYTPLAVEGTLEHLEAFFRRFHSWNHQGTRSLAGDVNSSPVSTFGEGISVGARGWNGMTKSAASPVRGDRQIAQSAFGHRHGLERAAPYSHRACILKHLFSLALVLKQEVEGQLMIYGMGYASPYLKALLRVVKPEKPLSSNREPMAELTSYAGFTDVFAGTKESGLADDDIDGKVSGEAGQAIEKVTHELLIGIVRSGFMTAVGDCEWLALSGTACFTLELAPDGWKP
jgi:hypothetical protein